MTNLLIIDTSGPQCALAIFRDGQWFEDTQNVERLHNRVVLPQLQRLAERAGVSDRRFATVAFAAGPGSFTGIRIAAAIAQGIAFASGANILPLSSSLALVRSIADSGVLPADDVQVATVIHSRRDACYVAAYRCGQRECVEVTGDYLHQGSDLPDWLATGTWCGVGTRPDWWGRLPAGSRFFDLPAPALRSLGRIAQEALARGAALDPEAGLPRYVHGDSPWRPAER